jgi:tRNA(Ile)-lysidine synthase
MAFLDGGQPGRITAGRVIFDRRRDGLYLVRENRGILPLHLPAGTMAIWDGRYRITNTGPHEIIVGPTAPDRNEALALFPGAPPAIAMRAVAAMPFIEANALLSAEDRENKGVAERSIVRPVLAPFDRFLPQFELRFGIELAVLLGCDGFPRLPVKDSWRKR